LADIKINDTAEVPVQNSPASGDLLLGTDISNTTNDPDGETVNFPYSGIRTFMRPELISKSATFTLASGDFSDDIRDAIIVMTNGSAATATVPANATLAIPVGTTLVFHRQGAGALTIAGATGVTLQGNGGSVSAGSCDVQTQYAQASAIKIATDTWLIGGDIDTVA